VPKDHCLFNVKTESTEKSTSLPVKVEEIKKETNVEINSEQVEVKQEKKDVKTEIVTEQKNVKIENEDEQNVKVDVAGSPGYVHIRNKINDLY